MPTMMVAFVGVKDTAKVQDSISFSMPSNNRFSFGLLTAIEICATKTE
jgi:hypothetical protein